MATILEDKKQKEIREKQKQSLLQEANDWEWLLADERGRRIVLNLLSAAGVYRTSFDTNALKMAFMEGRRNFGLYIDSLLKTHGSKEAVFEIETKGINDGKSN